MRPKEVGALQCDAKSDGIEMTGRAHFITAAGTDLGKTWVTAGLAQALRARGQRVRALKPVMSGYRDADAAASDAGRLLAACGRQPTPANVAAISPWRFAAPLSPDRAAALEGHSIDVGALVDWCRAECARDDAAVLIEGIGGVMAPLDAQHTVRDWIAALGLPTLLVCGTYLGAVSHALTALAALRDRGIVPAAVVLDESADGVGLGDSSASLAPHLGGVPLIGVGRDDAAAIDRLAEACLAGGLA